jgi:enoyl-CoA hydratase/carnithine racemase
MKLNTMDLKLENNVAWLTFTEEKKLNAISSSFIADLSAVIEEVTAQTNIRILVLTGQGKAFCAGADISEIVNLETVFQALQFNQKINDVFNRLETLPIPTLAIINGLTLGGGLELSLACDLRIASTEAKLGLPEVNIGVMPGAGGTQRLSRIIGTSRAKEMFFFGEPISAQQAENYGLVNKVVPASELEAESKRIIDKLLAKPALSLNMMKDAVYHGTEINLLSGIAYEGRLFSMLFASEDKNEGLQAFLEKRKPVFKGK